MALSLDLIDRKLAERSLADFVRQAWPVLEPKTPYSENWHHQLLIEALEAVAAGEIRQLIIIVPPRSGKSLLASIFFPVWIWLGNRAERFLFASYSSVLATKHSDHNDTYPERFRRQLHWIESCAKRGIRV